MTGIVSIFTYELQSADIAFKEAGLTYNSLTNFAALIEAAKDNAIEEQAIASGIRN